MRFYIQAGQSFPRWADGKKWKRGCVRKPSDRVFAGLDVAVPVLSGVLAPRVLGRWIFDFSKWVYFLATRWR